MELEPLEDSELRRHLEVFESDLHADWSPLPGQGDPGQRQERIVAAINRANTRAATWAGRWTPAQESEHIHRVVEGLGVMATNLSLVATMYAWSEQGMTIEVREHLQKDLENVLSVVGRYAARTAILTLEARTAAEADDIYANLLSIRVEHYGIQSILWAKDFTPMPSSIGADCVDELTARADELILEVDKAFNQFIIKATPAWLKAKIKSVLSLADVVTDYSYNELAASAQDDPRVSLEISKLALDEADSLEDLVGLMSLMNTNFLSLSKDSLWGEEHRRALASTQLKLYSAILKSARTGVEGRLAAVSWLNALREWSVGNDCYSPQIQNNSCSIIHLVCTDDRIARIFVVGSSVEFSEMSLVDGFWERVFTIHNSFDKTGTTVVSKSDRAFLAEALDGLLSLPVGPKCKLVVHGRTALVPWFSLRPKAGAPLASLATLAPPSPTVVHKRKAADPRKFLAIVDDSFGQDCASALNAWNVYTGARGEVVRLDTRKSSPLSSTEILCKIKEADEVLFFGHGQAEMTDYRSSRLKIGLNEWISPNDIASFDLSGVRRLLLIACQSGRVNSGMPVSSMGEAFSARGASAVISTLWSISSAVASQFLKVYLKKLKRSDDMQSSWAATIEKDLSRFGYFILSSRLPLA